MKLRTALVATTFAACADPGGTDNPGHFEPTPVTPVDAQRSPEDQARIELLRGELEVCAGLDADAFAQSTALPFTTELGYDPKTASGMDLIQASALALSPAELDKLGEHGFVVVERSRFPTFGYGYESIYGQDLPVYISADSILYALHRSYDSILLTLERESLIGELKSLLSAMRSNASDDADVDFYLTVALSLLQGEELAPVSASATKVKELYDGAKAGQGIATVELFGSNRDVDFSQFTPRGHYTGDAQLEQYFRAMMWLGRVDLRIIETEPDGTQVFRRRELEAAYTLRAAMGDAEVARWQRIHDAIAGFVGEPDSMTPPELDQLLADLHVDRHGLDALDDATIAAAIVKGGYGAQLIASQLMFADPHEDTLPLASAFLLFGQAYIIDSHVFSNLVYDRVGGGGIYRMMPSTLDVAYAALGNDQAGALLAGEAEHYGIAEDYCRTRVLVEGHGDDYWSSSLYTLWLGALRSLSPVAAELDDPALTGIPTAMATDAWGRRVLNAQLASWAELRHDTLLYAKQSYTGAVGCEFPDAYVEPNPRFFAAVEQFAHDGAAIVQQLDLGEGWYAERLPAYFADLGNVAAMLKDMAESQRSGTPFTDAQLAFVNDAVHLQVGCGDPVGVNGWYGRLFFDVTKSTELDPTIADVHTQPTDEGGAVVGHVLHVGTGLPRLMVVTANTCNGARAYVGLASSYFEQITNDFERLTDETWASELQLQTPADVPWMQDLVAR